MRGPPSILGMGNKLLSAWYFPVFALYSFSIVPSRDSKFNCAKIARLLLTFPTEHPGRCVTAARGASLMTYFVRFPGCQGGGGRWPSPLSPVSRLSHSSLNPHLFPRPFRTPFLFLVAGLTGIAGSPCLGNTPAYFLGPSGLPSFFLLPV